MRWAAPAALAGAWLLIPAGAHAHAVDMGFGPVLDGVLHLFLSFDDLLPVVAMALLAGLNGPVAGTRAQYTLPLAWLAGGVAGYVSRWVPLPPGITSLSLVALGILTAADRRLSPLVVAVIAAAFGLLHGWLNGAAIAAAGRPLTGLAGIAGAVYVLMVLFAAPVARLEVRWARIALRVAGSWIAAIGLLYLGWTLSGRG